MTMVSPKDSALLENHKWHAHLSSDTFYAFRTQHEKNISKKKAIRSYHYLHRMILETERLVDHKNQNSLDNRRNNLREATRIQNGANSKMRTGMSKFRGVSYDNERGKWVTQAGSMFCGRYDTELDAARAYNEYAKLFFKEFAVLNDV